MSIKSLQSHASTSNLLRMVVDDSHLVSSNATLKARAKDLVASHGELTLGELRGMFGGLYISEIGTLRASERAAILALNLNSSMDRATAGAVLGAQAGFTAEQVDGAAVVGWLGSVPKVIEQAFLERGQAGGKLPDEAHKLGVEAAQAAARLAKAKGTPGKIQAQLVANRAMFEKRLATLLQSLPPVAEQAQAPSAEEPQAGKLAQAPVAHPNRAGRGGYENRRTAGFAAEIEMPALDRTPSPAASEPPAAVAQQVKAPKRRNGLVALTPKQEPQAPRQPTAQQATPKEHPAENSPHEPAAAGDLAGIHLVHANRASRVSYKDRGGALDLDDVDLPAFVRRRPPARVKTEQSAGPVVQDEPSLEQAAREPAVFVEVAAEKPQGRIGRFLKAVGQLIVDTALGLAG